MTDDSRLHYWDSCIFIRYLAIPTDAKEEQQLENIKPLFFAAQKGEIQVVVSTLVLAELRPRQPYDSTHLAVIDDLLYRGRSNPRVVALTPPIARLASDLGSQYGKPMTSPDAVHLATALMENVTVFYTLDGDADNERRRSGKLLSYDGQLGNLDGQGHLSIATPPPPPIPDATQPTLL